MKHLFCLFLLSIILGGCSTREDDALFEGFVHPPAEARPFVRWWWNGNQLHEDEIIRELDVLEKAGIGGVEINPIAMPEDAKDIGATPLPWNSEAWNQMLKHTAAEAQQRKMIADLIVGSGWPFGGEFLTEDETIQRVIINKIPCSGGDVFNENLESLYEKAKANLTRTHGTAQSVELVFVRLIPRDVQSPDEIINLTDAFNKEKQFELNVPPGNYQLVYGILQKGNREVMHGAPGAAGPVMNHYERKITREYLNRLNKISQDTGTPLSRLIRALFCDSIELGGANWTDGMEKIFFETYQYELDPWYPFVFYDPYTGYAEEHFSAELTEQIKRVRYDFNKLLVDVFLQNFTQEFQDFCSENDVLCRYQAYGTPFLMGMMEGNMIPDIPESNNWIYSATMGSDEWEWNQEHGYMIWNLYAASGGHLMGRKIISSEAMTNTRGVFKTSLEEIKRHDDMNFITGINHSVLHGYNYSPPEAGFPGWLRYGSYFNEQNPWWPYFHYWTDYNARLSYVFQQTHPVKNIAILAPEADIWANHGLTRSQFHTKPWYCYRLWEPLSQAGSSCDYISQKIIQEGTPEKGTLNFGPMAYQAVFLCNIQSLETATALALLEFVKEGGKIVVIEGIPERSLSFGDENRKDAIVRNAFLKMEEEYPDRIFSVSSPFSENHLLSWARETLEQINIQKDLEIPNPDKNVFQTRGNIGNRDIYFFTNSHRQKTVTFNAVFPTGEKTPWLWNPEKGTRSVYPYNPNKNELTIRLKPLESLLLVFEPALEGEPVQNKTQRTNKTVMTLKGPWLATFNHTNGESFQHTFQTLTEFGTSSDPRLNSFAGTVTYSTSFNFSGSADGLRLADVNKGVTEVFLNGKNLGVNWYGTPVFWIEDYLQTENNKLEIKYTTVLSNYAMSLENNPTTRKWTAGYEKIPMGLESPVFLFSNSE